jgi:hypothetical protein
MDPPKKYDVGEKEHTKRYTYSSVSCHDTYINVDVDKDITEYVLGFLDGLPIVGSKH